MEPGELLREVETVQFYDWPHPDVVGSLLRLGKTVYGYEPKAGYLLHSIVDTAQGEARELAAGGFLGSTPTDEPEKVDLVVCYRPPEEQMALAQTAINKGAKAFWVQPPAEPSHIARVSTQRARMPFITEVDIRDAASSL